MGLYEYQIEFPRPGKFNTTALRAVVLAHAGAAVTPTTEGDTPAVAACAPIIGATAVASASIRELNS